MSEFATPPQLETDYSFTGGETSNVFERAPERVQNIALTLRGKLIEMLAPAVDESSLKLLVHTESTGHKDHPDQPCDEYYLVHAGAPLQPPKRTPTIRDGLKRYKVEDISQYQKLARPTHVDELIAIHDARMKEALKTLEPEPDDIAMLLNVIHLNREVAARPYEDVHRIPKAVQGMWLPTLRIARLPYEMGSSPFVESLLSLRGDRPDPDIIHGSDVHWYPPRR